MRKFLIPVLFALSAGLSMQSCGNANNKSGTDAEDTTTRTTTPQTGPQGTAPDAETTGANAPNNMNGGGTTAGGGNNGSTTGTTSSPGNTSGGGNTTTSTTAGRTTGGNETTGSGSNGGMQQNQVDDDKVRGTRRPNTYESGNTGGQHMHDQPNGREQTAPATR